jgi:hypothetical protein
LFDDTTGPVVAVPPAPPGGLKPGQRVSNHLAFSGAVLYRVGATDLTEVKRVSLYDLLTPECRRQLQPIKSWQAGLTGGPDVQRLFRVDAQIYAVSPYGVKSFDAASFADTAAAAVPGRTCPPPPPPAGYE